MEYFAAVSRKSLIVGHCSKLFQKVPFCSTHGTPQVADWQGMFQLFLFLLLYMRLLFFLFLEGSRAGSAPLARKKHFSRSQFLEQRTSVCYTARYRFNFSNISLFLKKGTTRNNENITRHDTQKARGSRPPSRNRQDEGRGLPPSKRKAPRVFSHTERAA